MIEDKHLVLDEMLEYQWDVNYKFKKALFFFKGKKLILRDFNFKHTHGCNRKWSCFINVLPKLAINLSLILIWKEQSDA